MKRYILLALLASAPFLNAEQEIDETVYPFPIQIAKGPPPPPLPKGTKVPVQEGDKVVLEVIPVDEPFLTGPLLCPSGHTIPYGHINLEPYVFFNNNIGFYNNHWHIQKFSKPHDNINFQYLVQVGVSERFDFSFIPQLFYNYTGSKNEVRYGDLAILSGYQIYSSRYDSWLPTTKVEVLELFPTGQYDGLDTLKLGTDIGGGGSYATNIKMVMTDLWYFGHHHFLALRLSNGFTFFTNVKVTGANAYGGDDTTVGTVKPGWAFNSILGAEFTLTKNWALAFDMDFTTVAKTKFSGTTVASVGRNHRSYLLSLAPALEYNFNQNVGLIGGIWFTVWGKNDMDFFNGVLALNWFFP